MPQGSPSSVSFPEALVVNVRVTRTRLFFAFGVGDPNVGIGQRRALLEELVPLQKVGS